MFKQLALAVGLLASVIVGFSRAESSDAPAAVVCPRGGTFAQRLAAREIRRYVYSRTGKLLPIVSDVKSAPDGGLILVVASGQLSKDSLGFDLKLMARPRSVPDQYMLKTIKRGDRPILVVHGDGETGVLYAAYRLAEHLGVRFYMHGDVVPDQRIELKMPQLDEIGTPLFDRRGIQPFHDFPEGPDWWDADAYKAVLGQLPKMRMNFFGLHTYPQGGVGPEPTVWIGRPDDFDPDGKVKFSYPSRHFTTGNVTGAWGYRPTKTGDYSFGAAAIFPRDDYAADYMEGTAPWNRMSPGQCNELFNRFGGLLDDVFGFARRLGIKTCIGTETPLVIPTPVQERLRAAGKDPKDPAVVQELYEGIFRRIANTHPLDYYWFWTPEGWTWRAVSDKQIQATLADFRAAIAAAEKADSPFTLATCGWVLGPPQQPSLFDDVLPKEMPMSCINRNVGRAPVEPGFAKVEGRPQWAIPWMEDDPALIIPQLWVGRMRKDAADARRYGCTGLLGIHWRTRILGPNVSALAKAAWNQNGWKPTSDRYLAAADFYADWALSQFGPEAAEEIAAVFARIDCRLPRPSDWVHGPGGVRPDGRPWKEVAKQYAFVDELAALRAKVKGPGNLERFDYWLNNFRYLREVGRANCTWARLNEAIRKVKEEREAGARKELARQSALPLRKALIEQVAEIHRYLLATVSTRGGMGTVTNWQQHVMPMLLGPSEKALKEILGEELPADAMPSKAYPGPTRLFVPVVRTSLVAGEPLKLEVVVLGTMPREAFVSVSPLGDRKKATRLPLVHVARGVYSATLPAELIPADFEYYVQVMDEDGRKLLFPPTAPQLNQTVVVVGEGEAAKNALFEMH